MLTAGFLFVIWNIGPGKESEWDDIYYTCWLEMLYQGVRGLIFYDAEKNIWGQAHVWAAWVIF